MFPLAPQEETGNVSPSRKYSPPLFKPKSQTASVPSLLPAYPTRTPSPYTQENMKDKRLSSSEDPETIKEGERETFSSLIPIKSLEGTHNDARLLTKGHVTGVGPSSSTLDIAENDEEENYGDESSLDWQSGDDSNASGESPNSMVTGAGGYKGIPWRRGTTGSPGPSELMEMEHNLRLRPAIAIASTGGSKAFKFTCSETAASAATEHWKQERSRSGGGKERKGGELVTPHQVDQGKGRVVIRGGVMKKV